MDDGVAKTPETNEESTLKSAESRKTRRRRERKEARANQSSNSGPSGASTPNPSFSQDGSSKNKAKGRGFDPEDDFIAFDLDSPEELTYEEPEPGRKASSSHAGKKEKGKERERPSGASRPSDDEMKERPSKRRRSRSYDKESHRSRRRAHTDDESEGERSHRRDRDRDRRERRDRDEKRDRYDKRDRDRHRIRDIRSPVDEPEERSTREKSKDDRKERVADNPTYKGKEKAKEREWDKGKVVREDEDISKRKYEMVFDLDDDYANKKQRTDAKSRKCPWASAVDWDKCNHVAEMLHKEVEAFTNWISPSPVEDEIRGLIVDQISRAVKKSFPDASVLPFGSYETKLYLPLGDIDLVILSESMAYSHKVAVLQSLANALRKAGITEKVTVIGKAKVPIIKFITTHGRFNVDISLNQENGILSGQIINGFLNNMHGNGVSATSNLALRSLVMVTKAFLSQRGMNEVFSGGLGSYSIVCMAVSFLQMHPKIRRGEIDPNKNLGVLLVEFFELYGVYFNYEQVGISLRDGGMYFNKKKRGWHSYEKPWLLSIEDPAEASNDISRGSYAFSKVRTTFAGAYNILASTAFLRAGTLTAKREGRMVSLRANPDPSEMSILASVMGITQETINHRRLVQEIYDKRTLHRMLDVKPRLEVVHTNGAGSSSMSMSAASKVNLAAIHGEEKDRRDVHKRRHSAEPENLDSGEVEVDQLEESDEDDGARYNIGRQPPKKRQKTGKREDLHTVFTTDDEDDEEDMLIDSEAEEAHYASPSDSDDEGRPNLSRTLSNDQRRSYWASKGGLGDNQEAHTDANDDD